MRCSQSRLFEIGKTLLKICVAVRPNYEKANNEFLTSGAEYAIAMRSTSGR